MKFLRTFLFNLLMLLACAATPLAAQSNLLERIEFDNEVERELFPSVYKSEIDPVELFVMMGPHANYLGIQKASKLLDEIVLKVKEPMAKKKTFTKQMEYLQEVLHAEYLKKYQLIAQFSELVDFGIFNCVTGTALNALVLKRLGIPYQIYERPDHAYLTAGLEETVIESTAPTEGVFTPDERFRKSLVNSLLAAKLVTQDEVDKNGTASIFSNALLPDKKIDLQQLAALQYRNDALQAMQAMHWDVAFRQYLKSHYLYPCDASMSMVVISGIMNIGLGKVEGLQRVKDVLFFIQNSPKSISQERMHEFLVDEVRVYCINHYSQEDWAVLSPMLAPYRDDTTIFQQANFVVLSHQYDAEMKAGHAKCYAIAKELYAIKPWNADVRNCLVDSYIHRFRSNNDYVAILDSMDAFAKEFPFARSHEAFHTGCIYFTLGVAASKYEGDDRKQGALYLAKFEALNGLRAGTDVSKVIGVAYSIAVRSYVREPDYAAAKRCLLKGLELAPYSVEMNSAKRTFGKELGVQ